MKPIASDYARVAAILRDMADHVQAHDSLEGSIEYSMPDSSAGDVEVMVRASYRIGNSMGQGGVRIVGEQ
jgi:hypothetical protein